MIRLKDTEHLCASARFIACIVYLSLLTQLAATAFTNTGVGDIGGAVGYYNYVGDSSAFDDPSDHGCYNRPQCGKGMPGWWVTEPYLNLWAEDTPVFYSTSLGHEIPITLTYKQRPKNTPKPYDYGAGYPGTRVKDIYDASQQEIPAPMREGAGNWTHNWHSFIRFEGVRYGAGEFPPHQTNQFTILDFDSWTANVFLPGEGVSYFSSSDSTEARTGLQLLPMDGVNTHIYPVATNVPNGGEDVYGRIGFRLVHPDGSQDLYGFIAGLHGSSAIGEALLTERIDPFGNSIKLDYDTYTDPGNGLTRYRLTSLTDYDGRETSFVYTNTYLLQRVEMPYGRTAHFEYNSADYLTNIIDAVGISSSMSYVIITNTSHSVTNLYSLDTPYGTTYFDHTDLGGLDQVDYAVGDAGYGFETNRIPRALWITYPDLSKELYLYRPHSELVGVPDSFPSGLVPTNTPYDTFDNPPSGHSGAEIFRRNSFHWSRRQCELLSTNDFTQFTTNDYRLATMKHWLVDGDNDWMTDVASLEWEGTPDGINDGRLVWYDYSGKPRIGEFGNDYSQTVVAERLPSGDTWYSHSVFNPDGLPSSTTATYTQEDGSRGTRTVSYGYTYETASENCTIQGGTNLGTANWSYSLLSTVTGPSPTGSGTTTYLTLSGSTNVQTTLTRTNNGTNYVFTTTLPRRLTLLATDALTNETTLFFNNRQQLLGTRQASGLTTTNLYGSGGFLQSTIALESQLTNTYTFTNGTVATATTPAGLELGFTWDDLQRLKRVDFPDTTYVQFAYTVLDLSGVRDRLGNWTLGKYNKHRQLTNVVDALNRNTFLSYCSCGTLESITDPLLNTTTFARDYNGRLEQVLTPGYNATLHRDSARRVNSVSNSLGVVVNFDYNVQQLVTRVYHANGDLYRVSYNQADLPVYRINANGITVTNQFDALGRLLARTYPNTGIEQFDYKGVRLDTYTDPMTNITRFGYDPAGRLATITNANLDVVQYDFDSAGRLGGIVDGNSNRVAWGYDLYGRSISKTNANNVLVRTNGYNAAGRLTAQWTPANGVVSFDHDAVGNLTNITYPDHQITLRYDRLNRLTNMTDQLGTSAFSYKSFGAFSSAIQTEDGPWANDTLTYGYQGRQLQTLTLSQTSGSWTKTIGYDNQRRVKTVTSPAGSFTNHYSGAGSLIRKLAMPGGNYITNAFDGMGALKNTWLKDALGGVLNSHGYDYRLDGLRERTHRPNGATVEFGYDNIGQLIQALGYDPGQTLRLNENFGYGYDAAGNLFHRTNNTLVQTFLTDALNQLDQVTRTGTLTGAGNINAAVSNLTVNGEAAVVYDDLTFATTNGLPLADGVNTFIHIATDTNGYQPTRIVRQDLPALVEFAYDANGNLTNDGLRSFAYDAADQLTNITAAGRWKSDFIYDGFGRKRLERNYSWVTGSWQLDEETRFIYDGRLVLQERDTNNAALVSYTRGLDLSGTWQGAGGIGGMLARTDTNSNTFYHADGAGNITALVDSNGEVVARYLYDPFGNTLGQWGTLADDNRYRFSSKEIHAQSGLYAYGFRFYDPNLHRWLNEDPVGVFGGLNVHRFVVNSPLNFIDAFGLEEDLSHMGCWYEEEFALVGDLLELIGWGSEKVEESRREFAEDVADLTGVDVEPVDRALEYIEAGMASPGGRGLKIKTLKNNKAAGEAFEQSVKKALEQTDQNVVQQVTIKTKCGTKTRIDLVSKDADTGGIKFTEAKSSNTAPLTRNQKKAFPEIEEAGGTVVGKGKPGVPGGAEVPPTPVDVVRPE